MTRDMRVQLIAGLVMLLSFAGSAALAVELTASAGRHRLTYTDRAEQGQSWEVSAGIAMGAFRGIFVNILWIRANDLKEAGKFHESVQLASAITRLQPRFPRVWAFHAWNLAYNISVQTTTREERWQWVKAGIDLLRRQGVPANPNEMMLYRELAWIHLHKIQGYTDDANQYYKRRIAKEWTDVLGFPPRPAPGERSRESVKKLYADWIRQLVEAPGTLEEAIRREPTVRDLAARLDADQKEPLGLSLLSKHAIVTAIRTSPRRAEIEKQMGPRTRSLSAALDDPALAKAWPVLLWHLRKRVIVDEYFMDPQRMLRYTEKYGPLDWRHPATHAVYWGQTGVENALLRYTAENRGDFDFINTDRVVIQAVQELYRSGEIYFNYLDFTGGRNAFFLSGPNPYFVDTYGEIVQELIDRSWADNPSRAYSFYAAGYENFLKDAIRFFYRRGQYDVAESYRLKLLKAPWQNLNDPERNLELAVPLDEFIENELKDRYITPYVAVSEVAGALQGAFVSGLLGGDGEMFRLQFEYARKAHEFYTKEQNRPTLADQQSGRMEQLDRNFPVVAGGFFANFMPVLSQDEAETVYNAAPEDLRRFAYDPLVQIFKQQVDQRVAAGARSFDQMFPEPSGMLQHRAFIAAYEAERSRDRANIENK